MVMYRTDRITGKAEIVPAEEVDHTLVLLADNYYNCSAEEIAELIERGHALKTVSYVYSRKPL